MTAMRAALPGRRLAAGRPLTRHPPAPDLLRPRRVLEVEDHDDIADVAFDLRRDVGVAAVEGEAVHAVAGAAPEPDLLRLRRVGHVVDAKADRLRHLLGGERRPLGTRRVLAVHQHQAIGDADLVGVDAGCGRHVRDLARVFRIADIDDRGAGRLVDMADVGVVAIHHDLPAALAIEVPDLTNANGFAHAASYSSPF